MERSGMANRILHNPLASRISSIQGTTIPIVTQADHTRGNTGETPGAKRRKAPGDVSVDKDSPIQVPEMTEHMIDEQQQPAESQGSGPFPIPNISPRSGGRRSL
eukprot:5933706-Pyramimonas_sp.AAC.1